MKAKRSSNKFEYYSEIDSMLLYAKKDFSPQKIKWKPIDKTIDDIVPCQVKHVGSLDLRDINVNIPGSFNLFAKYVIHSSPGYAFCTKAKYSKSDIQFPLTNEEMNKILILKEFIPTLEILYAKEEYFILYSKDLVITKHPIYAFDIENVIKVAEMLFKSPVRVKVATVENNFKNELFSINLTNMDIFCDPVAFEMSLPWRLDDVFYYRSYICRNKKMVFVIEDDNKSILFIGGPHED